MLALFKESPSGFNLAVNTDRIMYVEDKGETCIISISGPQYVYPIIVEGNFVEVIEKLNGYKPVNRTEIEDTIHRTIADGVKSGLIYSGVGRDYSRKPPPL